MSGILALASGTPLPNESESDHATDDATSEITDKTIGKSKVTRTLTLPVANGTIGVTQITGSSGNDFVDLFAGVDFGSDTIDNPVARHSNQIRRSRRPEFPHLVVLRNPDQQSQRRRQPDNQSRRVHNDEPHRSHHRRQNEHPHRRHERRHRRLRSQRSGQAKPVRRRCRQLQKCHVGYDRQVQQHQPAEHQHQRQCRPGRGGRFLDQPQGDRQGRQRQPRPSQLHRPGTDSGGDKFQSNDNLNVSGGSNSKITTAIKTDDGHGNTVDSTDVQTQTSKLAAGNVDEDTGSDSFADADANGQPTTHTEQDTETNNGQAQESDGSSEKLDTTIGVTDPTTGLKVGLEIHGNSGGSGKVNETENDKEVRSSSGVANPTSSETDSGEDDVTDNGKSGTNVKLAITTKGSDLQGNSVDLTEKITAGGSSSNNGFDDTTLTPDGTDKEVADESTQANAGVSDFLKGTIVTVDPATGVKTKQTYNDFIVGKDNGFDNQGDTAVTPPNGSGSDTPTDTSGDTEEVDWNIQEETDKTNPDGSPAAPR